MNSKQATKALNELVSYRDQFDPQDWKDYLYDEAVSFQVKTKSKREILLPEEIWDIIKTYAFALGGHFEIDITKSKLYKSLNYQLRFRSTRYLKSNVDQEKFIGKPLMKGTRILIDDNEGGFDVIQLNQSVSYRKRIYSQIKWSDSNKKFVSEKVKGLVVGNAEWKASIPVGTDEPEKTAIYRFKINYWNESDYYETELDYDEIRFSGLLGLPRNQTEVLYETSRDWGVVEDRMVVNY